MHLNLENLLLLNVYITKITKKSPLNALGHQQGNMVYSLFSFRPIFSVQLMYYLVTEESNIYKNIMRNYFCYF